MLIKTIYVDLRSIQIIIKFKLNQYYNIKKKKKSRQSYSSAIMDEQTLTSMEFHRWIFGCQSEISCGS